MSKEYWKKYLAGGTAFDLKAAFVGYFELDDITEGHKQMALNKALRYISTITGLTAICNAQVAASIMTNAFFIYEDHLDYLRVRKQYVHTTECSNSKS